MTPRPVAARATALAMFLAAMAGADAKAQSPQLLIDGNPLPGVSSNPTSFGRGPVDGTLTLVFDDGVHGDQLWVTDGTTAGTARVTNFPSGPGAIFRWFVTMADLTAFVVERGSSLELWRTDGTPAGTFLLHAGTSTSGLLYPLSGAAHGPVLFFADNGTTWRTDGTVAGTFPLGVPAAQWKGILFGQTLLYGPYGEVILSDGTTATVIGSVPTDVVVTNQGIYQVALALLPPSIGLRITALHLPGAPSIVVPQPSHLTYLDGGVVMIASANGLSRWDGFGPPQPLFAWSSFATPVLKFGTSSVYNATVPGLGNELVLSDGTVAGTRALDLQPGPVGSSPVLVGVLADRLLVWANTGGLGREPHVTDGTFAGTVHLGDLEPGPADSTISAWTAAGARRAVLAVSTSALGQEPWITDGTPAGTQLLGDIAPGSVSSLITIGGLGGSVGNVGQMLGGAMVFMADDGVHGREPWVLPLPGTRVQLQRYSTRRFDVGDPVLGSNVPLACRELQPTDLGLVVVGPPLGTCAPIAPRRCLHFDPFASVGVAIVVPASDGTWNGSLTLPNQPSAIGIDLVAQTLFVDATQPLGVDVGDAHWWSVGN